MSNSINTHKSDCDAMKNPSDNSNRSFTVQTTGNQKMRNRNSGLYRVPNYSTNRHRTDTSDKNTTPNSATRTSALSPNELRTPSNMATPRTPGTPDTTTPPSDTTPRTPGMPGTSTPNGMTTPRAPRMPGTSTPNNMTTPRTPGMPGTTTPNGMTTPRTPGTTPSGTRTPRVPMTPVPNDTTSPRIPRTSNPNGTNSQGMPWNNNTQNGSMGTHPFLNQGTYQNNNQMMPDYQGSPFIQCPNYPGSPNGNMYIMPNNTPFSVPMGIPLLPIYGYDNSDELDRDIENMRQLYPSTVRALRPYINDECDKLEYDGSVMFDEYPDKVTIDRIVDRIYEKTKHMENELEDAEVEAKYIYPRRRRNHSRDIITIILLNEFLNRRRRRRSRRRWF